VAEPIIQLKRNSLHGELANRLEELIVSSHWGVGQTLPSEREMVEQFGLSRSVVRDAMRILAAKGLVDIKHGVGAVVTQDGRLAFVELLDLLLRRGSYTHRQLLDARDFLEQSAAAVTAINAKAAERERIRECLSRYKEAIVTGQPPNRVDVVHAEFHTSLVQATGNPVLTDLISPMVEISANVTRPLIGQQDQWDDYLYHQAIYDAIARGDAEGSRLAVHRHMELSAAHLLRAGHLS
jgi:GntR family transcriptional repressor for pyruvate dehydrogenase complex